MTRVESGPGIDVQTPPALPLPSRQVANESRSAIDILASIWRHRTLALGAFFVVLIAGFVVAWVKGAPKYEARAAIFVSPRFLANLQDDKEFDLQSNSQYREYVQQNVRTINRYDIVLEAIERLGPKRNLWVQPKESLSHAAQRLQGDLSIQPVPDTYQIVVSLNGNKPEVLADVVNSVVDTFLSKTKSDELYGADDRLKNLREDRTRLVASIEDKQKQRAQLAETLGVSTFSEGFPNPYDRLLVDDKTALADARRQQIEAESQMEALHGGAAANSLSSLDAYALELTNKDPGFVTLRSNLNQRRIAILSEMSGLKPDHPGRHAKERELAELEAEEQREYSLLMNSYRAMISEQRQAEVDKDRRMVAGLTREVNQQTSQASAFSHGYQQAMSLGLDIDRERKRLDSIDDRISFLSLESRAPGFVRLFAAARTPDVPIKGGHKKPVLLAGILALLAGILTPIGVDFLDPRIRRPADVQTALGFPVLGWLMEKEEAGASFEREQVMRLASRLSQENQVNGSQVFAFTSVRARNGTTTIVHETAAALVRSGVSCLMVEANAYRADPRYRSPNSRGLTVILRGLSDFASEIVPGSAEEVDRLPVGDVESFGSLPDLQNLVEVLKQAKSVYSMVLVDLPPILASVDSELIARSSDVICLVMEAGNVTKGEVRRAARALERIRPPAVAAILNRVRLEAGASFARAARDEFYKGSVDPRPLWASPWLWK
jgi:polysaccharide biosynthesis transport protein